MADTKKSNHWNNQKSWAAIVLFAILAGVIARIALIGEYPSGIYVDEAYNGVDALRTTSGQGFKLTYPENTGREGGLIWVIAVGTYFFDNTLLGLRLPGALIGSLTIVVAPIAIYQTRLFAASNEVDHEVRKQALIIALVLSVFLALSYWHVALSRIAFRAILDPFFGAIAIGGTAFALRRPSKHWIALTVGALSGIGVYGYFAYKFLIFPVVLLLAIALIRDFRSVKPLAFLVFGALLTSAPWIYQFVFEPDLTLSRAGQVSIFVRPSPVTEGIVSAIQVLGMAAGYGDFNVRHNLPGAPVLNPIVFFFLAFGILTSIWGNWSASERRKSKGTGVFVCVLFVWLFAGLLPSILTFEGRPHALRAVGAIVPSLSIAAFGATALLQWMSSTSQAGKAPGGHEGLTIGSKLLAPTCAFLIIVTLAGNLYGGYFFSLRKHPDFRNGFQVKKTEAALALASSENSAIVVIDKQPSDPSVYVVYNQAHFLYFGWQRFKSGDAYVVDYDKVDYTSIKAPSDVFVPSSLYSFAVQNVMPGVKVYEY